MTDIIGTYNLWSKLADLQVSYEVAKKASLLCQSGDYEKTHFQLRDAKFEVRKAADRCGIDFELIVEAWND